jgi:hypothetical protein
MAFAGRAFSQPSFPDAIALDPPGTIHACFTPAGTLYLIQQPGLKGECSGPHTGIGLQAAGSPLDGLSFQVRTESDELSADAAGQASISVDCEPGEIAISGGGQVLVDGSPAIVSWVEIDVGNGPRGAPPTGWRVSYSYSTGSRDTTLEAWVLCVS